MRLGGVALLLTDTAGLRETEDMVEAIGVCRARASIAAADLVLWLGQPEDAPADAVTIHSRSDIAGRENLPAGALMAVSASTGAGLDALRDLLVETARGRTGGNQLALNHRQRGLLIDARRALVETEQESDPILLAERLRTARAAFDAVVGGAGVEDMLDGLFGRFCLGK